MFLDSKKTLYLKKRMDEINRFLHAGTNSCKLKDWKLKIFWVSIVENGCRQSGDRTLKLTVSEE